VKSGPGHALRTVGAALGVSLLLLAGCGELRSGASVCALVSDAEAAAALGVAVREAKPVETDHPQCTWTGADAGDGLPRTMRASLWRERALRRADRNASGALFFETQLLALEKDYPRTRVIGATGQVAVMGFGDVGDERFSGAIIVRKGGDVLVMQIDGADPAAFEAVARRIAEKM
jgi:hypothetical protein